MELQRGMRSALDKYFILEKPIEIEMNMQGPDTYDFCCFGVDKDEKLFDDRYMVFYNQISSPNGEIKYINKGKSTIFYVDLLSLPSKITKLVFTASIDGSGTMSKIISHMCKIKQESNELILKLSGSDFDKEKAVITIEIYLKDIWRLNPLARGFNGGLSELLRSYGGEETTDSSNENKTVSKENIPDLHSMPTVLSDNLQSQQVSKINLKKGQKVNLVKNKAEGFGEILINLNWKKPKGLFAQSIDLDLGCLYELKDGSKGAVQALGELFGSLDKPPYISLDGDDRSGSSLNGENLRINGKMVPKIKRILVYSYIYSGIANWKGAEGVVTVKYPGNPEIVVNMDEYSKSQKFCVIALFENVNDTLSVEKLVDFYSSHELADRAFNWGLKWTFGRKK